MCITLMTQEYARLKLLGETIYASFQDGRLTVTEVYDIFFSTGVRPLEHLLCVSPHSLIGAHGLTVHVDPTPGVGGEPHDAIYQHGATKDCAFDPATRVFKVVIPGGKERFFPSKETFRGQVVSPTVRLLECVEGSPEISAVMSFCGTVFKLEFHGLEGNTDYAFRLVVSPSRLLGLAEPRQLNPLDGERFTTLSAQDGVIQCPKTALLTVRELLTVTSTRLPHLRRAVAQILSLIQADGFVTLTPLRQRILLVLPTGADFEESSVGCIMWVGKHHHPGLGLVGEWAGGGQMYWPDDPELVAKRIFDYLDDWAVAEPKSKEDISTALQGPHENCSLIVDKLVEHGLVRQPDPNRGAFQAVPLREDEVEVGIRKIVWDHSLIHAFGWMGYECRFTTRHQYVSPENRCALRKRSGGVHSSEYSPLRHLFWP